MLSKFVILFALTCAELDISPATPFIAILLLVTTVSIPLPPANVKVSPEAKESFVPESADKVKEVDILEILEALVKMSAANEAEAFPKDPDISLAI